MTKPTFWPTSLWDYHESKKLVVEDVPFHTALMYLFRKADTNNLARLRSAFPGYYEELQARYMAPHGLISPGESWGSLRMNADGEIVSIATEGDEKE